MTVSSPKGVSRPGKRQRKIAVSVPDRLQDWIEGKLKPEDLTDEEVNRMQLMDKNGHFTGRPARMVPRDLALAFRSEQQKRLMAWFAEQVPLAQKAYRELLRARHLSPGDAAKLRAAEGIFERVIGKVPQATEAHVTLDKGRSFEDVTADVVADLEDEEEDDAEA